MIESDLPASAVAYRQILEMVIPRTLGLQNRNRASDTWGCLDRNFWHYKTLVDFPSATYQQPVLAFALVYSHRGDNTPFGGNPLLLEAARAAMLFWVKIQHRDGSFDEFYQNEHSFCPTAFTTFAVSETLLILGERLAEEEYGQVLTALQRAGDWLVEHDNPLVSNQMMAALNGLHNLALLTGGAHYQKGAQAKLRTLLESQHGEGWFPEYGGADIGYSFLALDFLGHFLVKTEDAQVAKAVERLLEFLSSFVHPDGTVGGFYGSRNTTHFLPYGLKLLAARGFSRASSILQAFGEGVRQGKSLTPLAVDDKYLAYFYLNSYAQALVVSEEERVGEGLEQSGTTVLPGAGLFVHRRDDLYLVGSGFKGGCFKAYYRGHLLAQEAGYFGSLHDGSKFSSQTYDPEATWEVREEGRRTVIEVECNCIRFDDSLPLMRYLVPFKIFTRFFLASSWLAQKFHQIIKARKVTAVKGLPLKLTRRILVEDERITISDTLQCRGSKKIASLVLSREATVAHSASSRYVVPGDLEGCSSEEDTTAWVETLNDVGHVHLERELFLN